MKVKLSGVESDMVVGEILCQLEIFPLLNPNAVNVGAKGSERCRVVYRFKPPKTIYKFHVGRGTMCRGDYSDIETKLIRRSV